MISEGRVADGIGRLEDAFNHGRDSFPALVLSSVYIDRDRPDLSLSLLLSSRGSKLSVETHLMLCAQLFHAGKFELSLSACELAFERFHREIFAYNAACSASRLGRIDDGLRWLELAVSSGFDRQADLDTDDDIALLRSDPRFRKIRAKLPTNA